MRVNYIYHAARYFGSLTSLLDKEGVAVISKIINNGSDFYD